MQQNKKPSLFYTYQKKWVTDASRFKIGLWSRQTGKSFSTSLEAVIDCWEWRTDWVFLSSGERQSKELIRKSKTHALALDMAFDDAVSDNYISNSGTVFKQLALEFMRGTIIHSLLPRMTMGNKDFQIASESRGIANLSSTTFAECSLAISGLAGYVSMRLPFYMTE
jgi:phage FluMu gp28-like protein